MRNLALKYRPRRLDEVYGQDRAVAAIRHQLATGNNQSLLFVGPSGTGKTTVARILGATRQCERMGQDPCGECASCQNILGGRTFTFGWEELDGARFSEKKHIQHSAGLTGSGHNFNWTYFIDEVHAISGAAADSLLKSVEDPGKNSQFIAATTELAAVRPPLLKRCQKVHFVSLSGTQTFGLLQGVCRKENIRYDPIALDMIAGASAGSAREALNMLDQIAWQGDVTPDLVAETLGLGSAAHVLAYFSALLDADPAAQERALYEWQAETVDKATMIRNFLLYCYNYEVMPSPLKQIVDPAFYQIMPTERQGIVARFQGLARASGRKLDEYWLDLMDLWLFDRAAMVDHASLSIKTRRFHRVIFPEGLEEEACSPASAPKVEAAVREIPARARTARSVGRERIDDADRQLRFQNQAEAGAIYTMASYLPQEHGLLFNTGLTFDHGLLGAGNEQDAGSLLSQLTHELSIRVKGWSPGDRAHWLYQHLVLDGRLTTNAVLHIPRAALAHVEPWVRRKLLQLRGPRADHAGAWSIDAVATNRAAGWEKHRIQRHWALVRDLWQTVDPDILVWNSQRRRTPLREVLRAPPLSGKAVGDLKELRSIGLSRSLGPTLRKQASADKMEFLSAFVDNAWEVVFSGWELDEQRDRQAERDQRQDQIKRVQLEFPDSENRLEEQAREAALERLRNSWPTDPRKRLRSWQGWWS